tara:strand:- start:991 stop:1434 length:444 start_codon:yes stop_codon:yes gene_type:complete
MNKKMIQEIEEIKNRKINDVLSKKRQLFMKHGISYRSFSGAEPTDVKTISNPLGGQIRCEFFSKEVIDSLPDDAVYRCAVYQEHEECKILDIQYDRTLDSYNDILSSLDNSEELFDNFLDLKRTQSELSKSQIAVFECSDILTKVKR